MAKPGTPLNPEQALQKLKHYCAYQERCHQEVVNKLYELGVWKKEHDGIVATLIEENYLNEERFAIQFAGGKFRIRRWGRVRIRFELKQRQVSEYCIKKALKQIDAGEYFSALQSLADEKYRLLKGETALLRKKKTTEYLIRKGYETALVAEVLSGKKD